MPSAGKGVNGLVGRLLTATICNLYILRPREFRINLDLGLDLGAAPSRPQPEPKLSRPKPQRGAHQGLSHPARSHQREPAQPPTSPTSPNARTRARSGAPGPDGSGARQCVLWCSSFQRWVQTHDSTGQLPACPGESLRREHGHGVRRAAGGEYTGLPCLLEMPSCPVSFACADAVL